MSSDPERLASADSFWLDADVTGPSIAIGALTVVDGPAPTIEEMRELTAQRLPKMERLRQRVRPSSIRLKRPTWETVDQVDLDHHVRAVTLDAPADRAALERLVGRIMEIPLDLDRPLWDSHVVYGLPDDGWAMVTRMHHAVADGQAAVLLMGRWLDTDPAGTKSLTAALEQLMAAAGPSGGSAPSGGSEGPVRDSGLDKNTRTQRSLAQAFSQGGDLILRTLRKGVEAAPEAIAQAGEGLSTMVGRKPGSLAGRPGDGRHWVSVDVSLSDVKRIRKAHGGTVNDVVMTLLSGGYRKAIEALDEPLAGRIVRVLVPVSIRTPGDLATNNQVSGLFVQIPVDGTAAERLTTIRTHINKLKGSGFPAAGKLMWEATQSTPAALQTVVVGNMTTLPAYIMETLVTNVPGPQFPIYLAGRKLRAMYPIIPLGGSLRVSTGVLSYDGTLNFGISGGTYAGDQIAQIREGISETLNELLSPAQQTPAPA